jgi:MFS family permease
VSGTSGAGSYRAVLALPYALRTFVPALLGRLSYGLLPLATLFTVHHATGSFTAAGAAVAAYGVTGLLMPLKARLIDRYGQRRVLPPLAGAGGTALAALAISAGTGQHAAVLIALAALAGVALPPLGPSMRATWRKLTEGTELKQRAFALDSICEETLWLVGPLVAGVMLEVAAARTALLVAAGLNVVGTLLMVSSPILRQPPTTERQTPRRLGAGPLAVSGLRQLALVIGASALGIAMAYTAIAATAAGHESPSAAGYIEAGIALGSVAGGLLWGRRRHTRRRSTHLAGLLAYVAIGMLAASLATGNLLGLGAAMTVVGVGIAPLFVVAFLAADEIVPDHQRTESSTWVNTANNVGSAIGAAVAGVVVDRLSGTVGFVLSGGLLALVAAVTFVAARRIDVDPAAGRAGTGSERRSDPSGR